MRMTSRQQGFSLIELLIVVAIIGIIAAIAIPNMLASRRAANEGSALASTRTLTGAQASYQSTKGAGSYGDLSDLEAQGLIDALLAGGLKSGYAFTVTPMVADATHPARYDTSAVPSPAGGLAASGIRGFYSNESGVIYYDVAGAAPVGDPDTRAVTPNTPIK